MTDKKTEVVCVKVDDIRTKEDPKMDLKKWVEDYPKDHEYIGREGIVFVTRDGKKERYPKKASIWANPFKVGNKQGEYTREDAIAKYEEYIRGKLDKDSSLVEQLFSLQGKKLGCWCKPAGCHGDVLVKLIDEYKSKKPTKNSQEESKEQESKEEESKEEEPKPEVKPKKVIKIKKNLKNALQSDSKEESKEQESKESKPKKNTTRKKDKPKGPSIANIFAAKKK